MGRFPVPDRLRVGRSLVRQPRSIPTVFGLTLAGLLLFAGRAGAQANLLANGSFEEPQVRSTVDLLTVNPPALPGWRITEGSAALAHYATWQPAEGQGRQSLLLGSLTGPGSMEQSFATVPGQYYLVSGWLAHHLEDTTERRGQVQLFLNGELLAPLVHNDRRANPDNMRWTLFARRFRAAGETTLVKLTGISAVLDGLAVTLTGSPAPVGSFYPIDLSRHINYRLFDPQLNAIGSDLSNLADSLTPEAPIRVLRDVPFLLDGVILVGPGLMQGWLTQGPATMPRRVEGIPVGRTLRRLHFLHATNFNSPRQGAKIGAYMVHYADGTTLEIPIRYGVDLADWWTYPDSRATEAPVAWRGISESATRWDRVTGFRHIVGRRLGLQLFMKTWMNPNPDKEIASLDMVTGSQTSSSGPSAPFLAAATGE